MAPARAALPGLVDGVVGWGGRPWCPWGAGDSTLGTTMSPGMPSCFLALLSPDLPRTSPRSAEQGELGSSILPLNSRHFLVMRTMNLFPQRQGLAGGTAGQGLGTGSLCGLSLSPAGGALTVLWPHNPPHTNPCHLSNLIHPGSVLTGSSEWGQAGRTWQGSLHRCGWFGDRERGLFLPFQASRIEASPCAQQQGLASP